MTVVLSQLLPLILGENEKILRDRERLLRLRDQVEVEIRPLARYDQLIPA